MAAIALAAAPPLLGSFPVYILSMWLIMAIAAIGLNIPIGLGSIFSFGHGAFVMIGAYATTIALSSFGWPLAAALVLAILTAMAVGAIIGLPALRLAGFSLAIVTFSFGFMLFNLVKAFDFTGGPQGLAVPDTAIVRMASGYGGYYLAFACFFVACLVFASLASSKTGRALRTLGENEIVARSLGISLTRYKLLAFVLSAAYAALAGGLLAIQTGFVAPDAFAPELSINLFAAVLIGGIGTLEGPIAGALFIVLIPELTQSVQNLGQIIYALLFCAVVVLFPAGLVGGGRRLILSRRPTKGAEPTSAHAPHS
jgi:branched-chain amino acid transport system permease protein